MVTKTVARPPIPRSTPSHGHSTSQSHLQKTAMRPSTTPLSPSRIPPSVGQALPPLLRSPAHVEARTPSPNYFGLIVEPASDPRASAVGPQDNWGGTSSIVSFGADSPKHLPLDANPEFEAFRRQTEGGKGFSLGHGNLSHFASSPGPHGRPKPERKPTRTDTENPASPRSQPIRRDVNPERIDLDSSRGSRHPTPARVTPTPSFFDIPRQQSPLTISPANPPTQRDTLSYVDERHPRLSLPQNRANPPSPQVRAQQKMQSRADTLPSSLEEGPALITPSQLQELLQRLPSSQYLLLDLRVSPQYGASRIQGALNLCIPTTLLKRPSFNLQKLQDTFSTDADKERFSEWRNTRYVIVYDFHSTEKKDALSAVNTLKKFSNEGWHGTSYILRGGFAHFSQSCPQLIDGQSSQENKSSKISLSLGTSQSVVAPVAGGCQMPANKNAANPFFGNIRQNTDLLDGVGQLEVKVPELFGQTTQKMLPTWLSKAAAKEDHGKRIADKFLRLELAEQSRMTKALSHEVSYGTPALDSKKVQIAGIEKGSKNRYNNIWPFEHARVKLQNRPDGACDYVNASHIHPSRSNKRYIASQGPLPATFEVSLTFPTFISLD